jgi:transcriptional regulator with XRE-family HTH domain
MNKTNVIAERCKKARQKAGLEQRQLAEKLNVTPGLISQWETGRIKKINPEHMAVLADLAKVNIDWLSAKEFNLNGTSLQWVSISLNEIPKELFQNEDFIKGVLWAETKLMEKNT